MAKLNSDWKVLPHGPLTEVEPGLLTVVGQIPMPLGNFPRRMTVVGLDRNRTALFSPIPLDEGQMAMIEALGQPVYLIVPNGGHRLDLRAFHARYPKAKIVTAPGSKTQVEEAAKPVQTRAVLGERSALIVLAGCEERELAMMVRSDDGVSLITNDVIGNVAHPKGIGATIMARMMGFGPTPRITVAARRFFIKDKAALAAQLRDWSRIDGLKRIIPSHGDIIDRPAAQLARLADGLD
jgi:hypothetical protein